MSQPAISAMPSQISRKIIAEPRSGSAKTSSAGTAAMASDVAEDAEGLYVLVVVGEVLRQHEDDHQLADLGRLDVGTGDVDPAPRAVDLRAEREHEQQRADQQPKYMPA